VDPVIAAVAAAVPPKPVTEEKPSAEEPSAPAANATPAPAPAPVAAPALWLRQPLRPCLPPCLPLLLPCACCRPRPGHRCWWRCWQGREQPCGGSGCHRGCTRPRSRELGCGDVLDPGSALCAHYQGGSPNAFRGWG